MSKNKTPLLQTSKEKIQDDKNIAQRLWENVSIIPLITNVDFIAKMLHKQWSISRWMESTGLLEPIEYFWILRILWEDHLQLDGTISKTKEIISKKATKLLEQQNTNPYLEYLLSWFNFHSIVYSEIHKTREIMYIIRWMNKRIKKAWNDYILSHIENSNDTWFHFMISLKMEFLQSKDSVKKVFADDLVKTLIRKMYEYFYVNFYENQDHSKEWKKISLKRCNAFIKTMIELFWEAMKFSKYPEKNDEKNNDNFISLLSLLIEIEKEYKILSIPIRKLINFFKKEFKKDKKG